MKLGLNACSFIVLMLIAGLAIAVPTATACTGYYWDANTKQMVCVEVSQLAGPTATTTKSTCNSYLDYFVYVEGFAQYVGCPHGVQSATQVTPQVTTQATTSTTTTTASESWLDYMARMYGQGTTITVQTTAQTGCDPSYPTVCIPSPPPDLDCKDIPYRRFLVLPPDPHHFDADHDGIGCEWD
jgi:hypothetical protein